MNIGIVTTWFERGAAYVSRAYESVLAAEHKVFIYARGGERCSKGDPDWDKANVCYAPDLGGPLFPGSVAIPRLHFYRWLRRNDIHVVFFNEQPDTAIVREVGDLGYVTGAYVDYYTKTSVPSFAAYSFLICNTRRHQSVFSWHPNCMFVPWGTDVELFRPVSERSAQTDEMVFFHSAGFGGVSLRKGTDLLVEAFARVTGPARLIIHSQAPITRYGEARKLIESDPRITFIERTVPPPGLYHLGRVYVYPSRLEGIGLSVPEALACGLPVVTTDNGPMNEFVMNGYNGALVRVAGYREREDHYYWPESIADVDDLAAKMQAYVNNPLLAEAHGRNARAYALEHLVWRRNASALPEVFAAVAEANQRTASLCRHMKWLFTDASMVLQSCGGRVARRLLSREVRLRIRARVTARHLG